MMTEASRASARSTNCATLARPEPTTKGRALRLLINCRFRTSLMRRECSRTVGALLRSRFGRSPDVRARAGARRRPARTVVARSRSRAAPLARDAAPRALRLGLPRAALLASLLAARARLSGSPQGGRGPIAPRARPSARPAQHRTSALRFSHAELDPALARSKDRARRRVLLGEAEENATPDDPASAYATHPLHGSVREHGYYYADVALGVPPRTFQVIVDTGSTLTYVPCASCGAACGRHTGAPPYDPEASATHEPVDCRSDACVHGRCSRDGTHHAYNRGYAEHSSVEGHVVKDVIHLGGDLGNLTVAFGCTTRETGGIHDQVADGPDGPRARRRRAAGADIAAPGDKTPSRCATEASRAAAPSPSGGFPGRGGGAGARGTRRSCRTRRTRILRRGDGDVGVRTIGRRRRGRDGRDRRRGRFLGGYGTVLDSGTTFTYAPTKVFDAFVATLDGLVGVDENDGHGGRPRLERVPGPPPTTRATCATKKKPGPTTTIPPRLCRRRRWRSRSRGSRSRSAGARRWACPRATTCSRTAGRRGRSASG